MELSSSSLAGSEPLLKTLANRGWCLGDVDQVNALIVIQSALLGGGLSSSLLDSVESELCNLDLRSFSAKSLPDPSLLRKSSHLRGPKVLQVSSVRDISRGTISESLGNSNNQRLLRLKLTDGHSDITAIEYSHMPSIPDDLVPGTKVRLENKAVIHSGIVCLNPKTLTVLGGVVHSLYEEWQMNQKYSGFSRSSIRLSQDGNTGGPPPFEKLQIGAPSSQSTLQGRFSQYSGSTSKSYGPTFVERGGSSESTQMGGLQDSDLKVDCMDNDVKSGFLVQRTDEKLSSSEARPKEVVESVPIQNQAAAQKLLQKMSQRNWDDHFSRGQKHRGKEKQEESSVLTLDEWERGKAGANPLRREDLPDVSQDEYLARQLQDQFDLEDLQVQRGPQMTEGENIRMSMFKFDRDDANDHGRTGSRGRGKGSGRGSRRGKGRGKFG